MPRTATVESLCHYPVKGLSGQTLDHVALTAGRGFPLDRVFALARPDSGFDPEAPRALPKGRFVVLARDPALALLDTDYDAGSGVLSITHEGQTYRFDLGTPSGRDGAAALVAAALGYDARDLPSVQSGGDHRFTDVSVLSEQMMHAISLINLDSVAAFSDRVGTAVSPARFRGNVLFSGLPPFSELEMIGQTGRIGSVTVRLVQRTRRCPATEVNLATGTRDLDVPRLLNEHYGHSDLGVYALVEGAGEIRPGDPLVF